MLKQNKNYVMKIYEKLHLQIHHVRINCISTHKVLIIILVFSKPIKEDMKMSILHRIVVYVYLQHFRLKFRVNALLPGQVVFKIVRTTHNVQMSQ